MWFSSGWAVSVCKTTRAEYFIFHHIQLTIPAIYLLFTANFTHLNVSYQCSFLSRLEETLGLLQQWKATPMLTLALLLHLPLLYWFLTDVVTCCVYRTRGYNAPRGKHYFILSCFSEGTLDAAVSRYSLRWKWLLWDGVTCCPIYQHLDIPWYWNTAILTCKRPTIQTRLSI